MNNIREIISLPKNNEQKIIKISAKCEIGDNHIAYEVGKYNYGVCKNCNRIMHNVCRSKKYCVICLKIDNKANEVCKNIRCRNYGVKMQSIICFKCNKQCRDECGTCSYRKSFEYVVGSSSGAFYCGECWHEKKIR